MFLRVSISLFSIIRSSIFVIFVILSISSFSHRESGEAIYFDSSLSSITDLDKSLILDQDAKGICQRLGIDNCKTVVETVNSDASIGLTKVIFNDLDICGDNGSSWYWVNTGDVTLNLPDDVEEITVVIKRIISEEKCVVSKNIYI